ncbi:MAG: sulfite exporter TauE/SafE family protein [Bradyrhizobium sp.]|nr:sulfite exporter TauE/SafE family protein [Bradyrhizobium sp.]
MGITLGGAELSELIELALLLIATGALSGFLAGLFGIGGGAVLVPVFYECFRLAGVPLEVRMPLCIGTSLAVIIPTSIRSFRAHYLRGAVDMDVVKAWWLVIIVGVVVGSGIARYAPERLFKYVFVAVAWSATLRLWLLRDGWNFGDEMPKGQLMKVFGFFVGLLSTLMGVGGGLFSNLLMTFYGRSIHQSVATSSALAVLISIPGAIGYIYAGWPVAARFPAVAALQMPLAFGYVSLIGAALVMPMSLFTAPLGVKAAHAMSKRMLEIAFGLYLFIVGGRFVISLLTGQ